jgi:hypothetical protein
MRVQGILTRVLGVLLMVAVAVPASANPMPNENPATGDLRDVGEIGGWWWWGKGGTCSNLGGVDFYPWESAGLGLPLVNRPKTLVFSFDGSMTSLVDLVAVGSRTTWQVNFCGFTGPVGKLPNPDLRDIPPPEPEPQGIGAACGISKGWGGRGMLQRLHPEPYSRAYLRNLGWKVTVAETVVVTADIVAESKTKTPVDRFTAVMDRPEVAFCRADKMDNIPLFWHPKSGHTGVTESGTLLGVYAIGPEIFDLNAIPGTCKDSDEPTCLFHTKPA